jgi:hypothetical protein
MLSIKKIILFIALSFAVYSQYKAEQTVEKMRSENARGSAGRLLNSTEP